MYTDFANFFVASTGAGAALAGLLFVVVAVAPDRIVGRAAPPEARAVATSAFTALVNAFFVSLGALIPGNSLGFVALIMACISLVATVRLLVSLVQRALGFERLARRLALALLGGALYGYEGWLAFNLLRDPTNRDWAFALTGLLLGIYGMGLTRAWQLLGAEAHGVLGWLSPLQKVNRSDDQSSPVHVPLKARKQFGRRSIGRN